MPIQVTCPKCFKRFQVSDKFAGKTGPCPNCKSQIKVPETQEEVVIHAPQDDAPKDSKGRSVLKPLKRTETEVTRRGLILTFAAILLAIGVAIGIRATVEETVPLAVKILGAILLAPPLAWAGYTFVRDSELAPYTGNELYTRVAILSAIFAATWLIYAFIPSYLFDYEAASEMSWVIFGVFFTIMLVVGAIGSAATFEFEFSGGLTHAGLYLLVTFALGALSGIQFATAG